MQQYRVSLWTSDQTELPDLYFEVHTNRQMTPDELVIAAMHASKLQWAYHAEVEIFERTVWRVYHRTALALLGAEKMTYEVGYFS